ncbi:MAG: DUF2147 domain-containing protein [Minwuia sp.]|uniref:DUF2147 domain-containing protein n=1 Tax=Minwuia sp. TaxID=2493630 RepID=UPI003A85E770
MNFRLTVTAAAFLLAPLAASAAADDPVVGTWWNEEKTAHITIEPCGDSVCGKISWMNEPNRPDGTPKLDVNNEDEAKQSQPILGLQIIGGFEKEEVGRWEDGEIYNPQDGNSYNSNIFINDDGSLGVEGCVLFLCKEQTWTPVTQ